MSKTCEELLTKVHSCFLQKLTKTDEDSETHPEYELRLINLENNFEHIVRLLGQIDLKNNLNLLAVLKVWYIELGCDSPWNKILSKDYAELLEGSFNVVYGLSLKNCFRREYSYIVDSQDLFTTCIRILHENINANNFKYYPNLVVVYSLFLENLEEYNIIVNASTTLPLSLYLIDDYNKSYKIIGLNCCFKILKCLTPESFSDGNYYEVIYRSLRNAMVQSSIDITTLVLDCILLLAKILPRDMKSTKLDDILKDTLLELYTESNIPRKAVFFNFLKNIIEIHGINCVKRQQMKPIFCENIKDCCNDAVADVLLNNVLECFETWLKFCWCTWRLSSDHKLLNGLLKLQNMCKGDKKARVITIIITIIDICSTEEQKQIYHDLNVHGINLY